MATKLKKGGGVKGLATKKKYLFKARKKNFKKKMWPLSLRGVGVVSGPQKITIFCGFIFYLRIRPRSLEEYLNNSLSFFLSLYPFLCLWRFMSLYFFIYLSLSLSHWLSIICFALVCILIMVSLRRGLFDQIPIRSDVISQIVLTSLGQVNLIASFHANFAGHRGGGYLHSVS